MFEVIAARYEFQSIAITANRPFEQRDDIFPVPAMTVAAIDGFVHHAALFEMNVESYRCRQARPEGCSLRQLGPKRLEGTLLESSRK